MDRGFLSTYFKSNNVDNSNNTKIVYCALDASMMTILLTIATMLNNITVCYNEHNKNTCNNYRLSQVNSYVIYKYVNIL